MAVANPSVKDMTYHQYKSYYFESKAWKSKSVFEKLAFHLKVKTFKFTRGAFGWDVRSRFNPWNPLTYIVLILLVILGLLFASWRTFGEMVNELKTIFKYQ